MVQEIFRTRRNGFGTFTITVTSKYRESTPAHSSGILTKTGCLPPFPLRAL